MRPAPVATHTSTTRRSLLAGAGLLAATGPLAACGLGSGEPRVTLTSQPVQISFSTDWSSGARLKVIEDSLRLWKDKHPNVTVEVRHGGNVAERLVAEVAAGTQADIVLFTVPGIMDLREHFLDLAPFIKRDAYNMKDFTPIHPALMAGGGQYGMPFQPNMYCWFFNRTLFQREGVALPTDRWTWDDMADAARKLNKPGQQWGLDVTPPVSRVLFTEFLLSNGGEPLSKDQKRTTLNTPQAAEAGRWAADRILKDRTVISAAERREIVAPLGLSNAFQAGKAAMMHANIGWVGNLETSIGFDRFEWDLMWTPKAPKTRKALNIITEQPHAVTKNPKRSAAQTDAAWAFTAFMSGPEVMTLIAEQRTSIPVHRKALNGERYLRRPPAGIATAAKLVDSAWFEPVFPGSDQWSAAVRKELDAAWAGTVNVDDALRAATAAGDAQLAQAGRR